MEIKNHEIIHEISRGAITTVYKARHLSLDRIVLLKVLNQQWLNEKDLLQRFKREAQISAKLDHPNIVKVYDFNVSQEQVFISLEYIEGYSLEDYIKQNYPVDIKITEQIIKDIISAINYAHHKTIIHRDIKPSNIIIDKIGKAYLTDFGLASLKNADQITQQGHITGTPAYLAPERVKGHGATEESDLFSLGITFYELVYGESPFLKNNTAATLQSILTDSLPLSIRKDIPEWLVLLIAKLTDKNPQERITYINLPHFKQLNNIRKITRTTRHFFSKKYGYTSLIVAIISLYLFFNISKQEKEAPSEAKKNLLISKRDYVKSETDPLPESNTSKSDSMEFAEINTEKIKTIGEIAPTNPKINDTLKTALKTGGLIIRCSPWANVFINGDSIDITPMNKPLLLQPGEYELKLQNPNYASLHQTVNVYANTIDTLSFKLKETYGFLLIEAKPWAKIYINNEYKEDTPLLNAILVKAGKNVIELVNPRYPSINDTIDVAAGQRIQRQYSFAD